MNFSKYEKYRDSETVFGIIPSHWSTVRLGYISDVIDPQPDHRAPEIATEGGLPYIGIRDVNRDGSLCFETARQVVEKAVVKQEKSFSIETKDILFGKVGTLGQSKHIKPHRRFAISATLVLIKGKKNVNRDFLKYALDSNVVYNQIENLSFGATRPALGIQQVRKLVLAIPPTKEQKQIADFLDRKTAEIDQAIAQKQRLIELLKEQKAILIDRAVSSRLKRNAQMQDSGFEWLGEVPEQWEIFRAKYLFKEIDERSQTGEEELLSVSHITGVTPRSEKNVNMFMAEDYSGSKLCRKDDLVVNIMWAWMGALGISNQTGIVSSSYGVFRQIKSNIFNSWYLENLLRSKRYIAQYNRISTGLHSSRLRWVQMKKDGHAASDIGALKVATGNSFGVIPEVKIL
jgi:type I restriction enzyme, S subunit